MSQISRSRLRSTEKLFLNAYSRAVDDTNSVQQLMACSIGKKVTIGSKQFRLEEADKASGQSTKVSMQG